MAPAAWAACTKKFPASPNTQSNRGRSDSWAALFIFQPCGLFRRSFAARKGPAGLFRGVCGDYGSDARPVIAWFYERKQSFALARAHSHQLDRRAGGFQPARGEPGSGSALARYLCGSLLAPRDCSGESSSGALNVALDWRSSSGVRRLFPALRCNDFDLVDFGVSGQ